MLWFELCLVCCWISSIKDIYDMHLWSALLPQTYTQMLQMQINDMLTLIMLVNKRTMLWGLETRWMTKNKIYTVCVWMHASQKQVYVLGLFYKPWPKFTGRNHNQIQSHVEYLAEVDGHLTFTPISWSSPSNCHKFEVHSCIGYLCML